MNTLHITARWQIHDGQLPAFKLLADQCLSVIKEKEKDTLQYLWFFNPSETECVVREAYRDSDSLLAHLGNLGDLFGKLLAIADFSAEVYGQPSEQLLQATSGLSLLQYNFYQGV